MLSAAVLSVIMLSVVLPSVKAPTDQMSIGKMFFDQKREHQIGH